MSLESGDPKYWDLTIHGKLAYLIGFVQGTVKPKAREWPDVAQDSDEALVDALIRMLQKNHDR
jgi:hypothetical protein